MSRWNRREFVRAGLAASAAMALPHISRGAASPNEAVNLGFISCGGRGAELMGAFSNLTGVNIAGLSDPDQERLGKAQGKFPHAKAAADLRRLLDDREIDAVVIAACNHWHCLAAIWAMQAGKDVYVEKPLSHSQWEGQQTVAAAAKYKRICQVGTQQRSDPMQAEIKKFLHTDRTLGKILSGRVNRYGVRAPIGKRAEPLPMPAGLDYNLWLGPAQDEPVYRDKLQYDWHWVWNTGSGEMGNWGVHVLDDLRNNVFQDSVTLPRRIFGGGGRAVWNDAGETPNVHFVYFDTGSIPVVIGLTNLPASPTSNRSPQPPGPGSGYVAYCEGGRLEGQRGRAAAFDKDGKLIREFKGTGGMGLHQQNFLDAVRRRDPALLTSGAEVGHHSTGWCNLANIAFRCGSDFTRARAESLSDASGQWSGLLKEMDELLRAHGLPMDAAGLQLSPMLEFDARAEQFVGPHADVANQYLKRAYRAPFVVPEVVV